MLSIDRAVAFLPELYVFRVGQFFSVSVEWLAVRPPSETQFGFG